MTAERDRQLSQIFSAALELGVGERPAYLERACGGDEGLRREVERLLAGHEQAGDFLNAPVFKVSAGLSAEGPLVGRQLGHYQVLQLLGTGGMGEVYLARDTQLGRRVALKLLQSDLTSDPDRVRRFEQEARAASALNHPNILTIYELGQADGLHFIAAEYVEGRTLRQRITAGRLPLAEALEVALQVAGGLQVAHAAGIIHRDIKPENLMLRPDGIIKILDFGLAKLTEKPATGTNSDPNSSTRMTAGTTPGTLLGTISYMSPEQARGIKVDSRTDIWSLGVVTYEIVAGHPPFPGETTADLITAILSRDPPPLAHYCPQAPGELEWIVAKALAKDRGERYQIANELAIDLKRIKHRLELEAQPARAAAPVNPAPAVRQPTEEQATPQATSPGQAAELNWKSTRLSRWLPIAAALLAFALIGFAIWVRLPATAPPPSSPPAAPERVFTYSLTVQKMREGKPYQAPFESSGQEIFENGSKFRLNLSSRQPGFLYLLNEGPAEGGGVSYHLLFPISSVNHGSAQLAPNEPMQTGWYVLSEHQGTEKLGLVWAAKPVAELEAVRGVVNPQDLGAIKDPRQVNAVREFLARHANEGAIVGVDKVNKQTQVSGRSEVLVRLIELEHH